MSERTAWRPWARRLVALVGCATFVVSGATAASASAYGGLSLLDSRALLVNHVDGSDRSWSDFDVRITRTAAVRATNLAVALSRCDDCRTVAVSFQVLVAAQDPTDVHVTNRSAAVNDGCSRCDALALAYQFVVVSDKDLEMSIGGYRELARAKADLRMLLHSAPADAVIEADVAAIATRVQRVLASELSARPVEHVHVERQSPRERSRW
ncbi:MAG: hypothetical protein ACXV2I_05085 [Actinomycetes bacterium]